MPDGYGNDMPSWALAPRASDLGEAMDLIKECIEKIDKLNSKLELRDKKIKSLEGKVERLQRKLNSWKVK